MPHPNPSADGVMVLAPARGLYAVVTPEGGVNETNDRIYTVEPTPWYAVRNHFRPPFTLRCWGNGHWCRCDGQASHYPTEEAAHEAGKRWIESGRDA